MLISEDGGSTFLKTLISTYEFTGRHSPEGPNRTSVQEPRGLVLDESGPIFFFLLAKNSSPVGPKGQETSPGNIFESYICNPMQANKRTGL